MVISDQSTNDFFEQQWQKYHNKIFRRVIYITGNIQASEDITQDTFTKLYNSPPAHNNIEAWLKRVSTNLAYNFIRDEKLNDNKNEQISQDIEQTIPSAEDKVVNKIEYIQTKKILNLLKPNERLCLLLKFSGYKYNEIADIIQINKNSVGKIISRSQEKFKKLYCLEVEK
jgi:RNA polymerase sigma factor (sigma-70 family)